MKKNISILLILFCFETYAQGEKQAFSRQSLIPIDYNYLKGSQSEEYWELFEFQRVGYGGYPWGESACDWGKCKTGYYDKIVFKAFEKEVFYAKGELFRKGGGGSKGYCFTGPISVTYVSNGQLFYKGNYIHVENTSVSRIDLTKENITFYHENGKVLKEYTNYADSTGKNAYQREKKFSEEGVLLYDIEYANRYESGHFPNYYDPYLGRSFYRQPSADFGREIGAGSSSISYIDHGVRGSYVGYKHLGTYNTANRLSISGFILPTIEVYGNGSVVYVQDHETNENFFCVYFDGALDLRYKIPADNINPTEFIEQLNKNTYYFHTKARTNEPEEDEIHISSNDFITIEGYGINYRTILNDASGKGTIRNMSVGFFKGGRLNGLGYKVSISPRLYKDLAVGAAVAYEYGFFENGILVKGERHDAEGELMRDLWHPVKNPNFLYSSRDYINYLNTYDEKTTKVSEVWRGTKIYVTSVNRVMEFVSYKATDNSVTLKSNNTYEQNVIATKSDGLFKMTQTSSDMINQTCHVCEGKGTEMYKGKHTVYRDVDYEVVNFYSHYHVKYTAAVEEDCYLTRTCSTCDGVGRKDYKNFDSRYELSPIVF